MEPLRRVTAPTLDVLDALLAGTGPLWGLIIIKQTGRPSGTIYPILERLERQKWIEGSWDHDAERSGPRRRRYEFTADGRAAARDLVATAEQRRAVAAARPSRATARRPATAEFVDGAPSLVDKSV